MSAQFYDAALAAHPEIIEEMAQDGSQPCADGWSTTYTGTGGESRR